MWHCHKKLEKIYIKKNGTLFKQTKKNKSEKDNSLLLYNLFTQVVLSSPEIQKHKASVAVVSVYECK